MAAMAISVIDPAHGDDGSGLRPAITIGLDLTGRDEVAESLDRDDDLSDSHALRVYLADFPIKVRGKLRVGIGHIASILDQGEKLSVVVLRDGECGNFLPHNVNSSQPIVALASAWNAALNESRA